ncbi:MAG: dTDP-4-amino-4,6-dideoxy-D-glucose transaminase [Gemmatimonadota bacterium]
MSDPNRVVPGPSAGGIRIPFNRPFMVGAEFDHMRRAYEGLTISEGGPFTTRCEALLAEITGAPAVLLTSSCTHALELTALLLDLGPGDEVIVPSFTFASTANAFAMRGATPVFADVREDTLNIDEARLAGLITPRTRAVVVVHYAGVACAMEPIVALCDERKLTLVEDNAHGLLGHYRGTPLGRFGALATQSFHETKNLTCGKGGALLLNDLELLPRAEILREKGTNRRQFAQGLVDKYTWVDLGSSYLPPDILSAMLLAQIEARDTIQEARLRIWNRYHGELAGWADDRGARLPVVPEGCDHPAHLYYVLLPDNASRNRFLEHMRARGILSVFHYVPLHLSPMGRRMGGTEGACPVTESVSGRLARLPLYTGMTAEDQGTVIEAVRAFVP